MSYKVIYHKKAQKFIKSNKIIGLKFMQAFDEISLDPKNMHKYDIATYHTKGLTDSFRMRIGKYRAIFRIVNNDLYIFVFNIGSRGDIYK